MENLKNIYFLGIGGIGMSALARYFKMLGSIVSGYDLTPTSLTDELINEGIDIHFSDNIDLLPKTLDLIIYTPAIPKDHSELNYFIQNGYLLKKRSEVLGMITKNAITIAVAGTHGKTTVSTLIAHILKNAGISITAFLGGISKNYKTNFISSDENPTGQNIFVVEADEFDRSFLTLYPDFAVITSLDADHLDIYGDRNSVQESFYEFSSHIKQGGHLVIKNDLGFVPFNKNGYSFHNYGMSGDLGYSSENLRIINGRYHFDLKIVENSKTIIIKDLSPGLPGLFNVENSIAAFAIADKVGVPHEDICKGIESYEGVVRRFDYQIQQNDFIYIDDYAHHPAEIRACVGAIKKLYPEKKITGVFQPHLFSRTSDFADDFAESLSMLDKLFMLEIYPAREEPVAGVNSKMLLDKVKIKDKTLCSKDELVSLLKKEKPEVLVTMGAGDIDRLVEPIKNAFAE